MSDILHRAIKSINADAVYVSAGTLDEIKWLENTIEIYDNRCTMHYAIEDYITQRRKNASFNHYKRE